jgi:hypothetical protein
MSDATGQKEYGDFMPASSLNVGDIKIWRAIKK